MKKGLIIVGALAVLSLSAVSVEAKHDTVVDTQSTDKTAEDLKLGAKVDLPNLVKISENSSIGVEGGKDLHDTDGGAGWFGFLKFTWKGTFFDFTN